MLKKRIASILLASVMAVGGTAVTAFAEEPATADDAFQAGGKKAAAYRQMTDEERAELRAQIFANLTDEQKAAIIEKMGGGKGASGHGKIGKGAGQGLNGNGTGHGKIGKGGASGLNHNRADETAA